MTDDVTDTLVRLMVLDEMIYTATAIRPNGVILPPEVLQDARWRMEDIGVTANLRTWRGLPIQMGTHAALIYEPPS